MVDEGGGGNILWCFPIDPCPQNTCLSRQRDRAVGLSCYKNKFVRVGEILKQQVWGNGYRTKSVRDSVVSKTVGRELEVPVWEPIANHTHLPKNWLCRIGNTRTCKPHSIPLKGKTAEVETSTSWTHILKSAKDILWMPLNILLLFLQHLLGSPWHSAKYPKTLRSQLLPGSLKPKGTHWNKPYCEACPQVLGCLWMIVCGLGMVLGIFR